MYNPFLGSVSKTEWRPLSLYNRHSLEQTFVFDKLFVYDSVMLTPKTGQ